MRLVQRSELLALQVLNQRDLHHLHVVRGALHDGELAEADLDGRVVAALPGDDLVPAAALPDDERFDDALLGDGRHELREVAHHLAGLAGIRIQ